MDSLYKQASQNLKFLFIIGYLKKVKRKGWILSDVKNPESVSDHMYRMAMTAFLIPSNDKLDANKCIRMALVHDLAESLIGDITPHCGISKEEKLKRESLALNDIISLLADKSISESIMQLWEEYEAAESPEAIFVQDSDKFEMILSALEYETEQGLQLSQFFETTKQFFKTDLFKELQSEIIKLREDGHTPQ